MREIVRRKALLGFKLTERERAMFILFYGTSEEVRWFLKNENRSKR